MGALISFVIMVGVLVWGWAFIARRFKQSGRSFAVRHLIAGPLAIVASLVIGGIAANVFMSDEELGVSTANTASSGDEVSDEVVDRPLDDYFSILSDEVEAPYKRTVEVILYDRVNEEQLEEIGRSIKAMSRRSVDRTFIGYRLEGQDPDTAYWGTTHYTPDLSVHIMGFTADQYQLYSNYDPASDYDDVIGAWLAEYGSSYIAVAYEGQEGVYVDSIFPGEGEFSRLQEVTRLDGGELRLQQPDDTFGEYFIIDAEGNLQFWSENGNYYTAMPLTPSPSTSADTDNLIRTDLGELLEEGQVIMSPYRHSSDPDDIGMCMHLMEHNQATVDEVREQIRQQPSSDYMAHLGMAAVDIRHCVSCSLYAEENCDKAAELLAEADELE